MSKEANVFVLIMSVAVLFGAFIPVAVMRQYFVTISNIKGFSYLLYLTPFFIMGPAIATLYGKKVNEEIWYVAVGGIGLILSILVYVVGRSMLASFFENGATPSIGLGSILMILGYGVVCVFGAVKVFKKPKKETPATSPQQ